MGRRGSAWTLAGFSGSYGMNSWLCRNWPGGLAPGYMFGFNYPNDTWELPVLDDTIVPLFADCNWVDGFPLDTDPPPANLYAGGSANPGDMNRFCIIRHRFRTNVGFLDGPANPCRCRTSGRSSGIKTSSFGRFSFRAIEKVNFPPHLVRLTSRSCGNASVTFASAPSDGRSSSTSSTRSAVAVRGRLPVPHAGEQPRRPRRPDASD